MSTVESLAGTLRSSDEIIVIDDGSTDGSGVLPQIGSLHLRVTRTEGLGACCARNLGGAQASGEVVIFSDAHMQYPKGWWEPLVDSVQDVQTGAASPAIADLQDPSRIGYGMQFDAPALNVKWLPHPALSPASAPILPGACLAIRKEVFAAIGGFDERLVQWGVEDCELSLRLWLAGYDLVIIPEIKVQHLFRGEHPYEVKWTSVLHNKLRLASLHFAEERATLVTKSLSGHPQFAQALALLDPVDIATRRSQLLATRVRTPELYFTNFEHDW